MKDPGMGMLEEVFADLLRQVGGFACCMAKAAGATGLAWIGLKVAGIEPQSARFGVAMALFFFGSVMFFLGRYQTGKGFWAGLHGSVTWVDRQTPLGIWRLAGGVCWVIGMACAVFMD